MPTGCLTILRAMDGLIALLSLGLGVAAWWWVAKTLGAKGSGVVVRHLAGAAAWFFGSAIIFGSAQAVGLVKPAEPSAPQNPKAELDLEEAEPPAPTKVAPVPAAIKPTEKLTPKPKPTPKSSPTRGVRAEYLAAEFCPDHSPCYTFTDADRIQAARRGKSVHVVGTLTKAPSTPLFSDGPVAVLEGKQFCSVSLEFGDGDDRVLDMKQRQTVSARCVYEKGGEKGVSLKNCKLVPAPSSVEPLPFSWNEVAVPELPPVLKGMSPAEVDQLYRAVLVDVWNGQVTMGRDHARVYASLAEKIGVHVDKLTAAHEYVEDKQKALAYGLRLLLDRYPEIAPEYYGPVGATAYGGSYTFDVELHLTQHCPSDGEEQAKKCAGALVQKARGLLPPQATALRVRRVHYECEKLGTKGVLDFGYLWRLDESQPKEMSECSGTYGMTKPEHTVHWCQSSWTDGKPLEN